MDSESRATPYRWRSTSATESAASRVRNVATTAFIQLPLPGLRPRGRQEPAWAQLDRADVEHVRARARAAPARAGAGDGRSVGLRVDLGLDLDGLVTNVRRNEASRAIAHTVRWPLAVGEATIGGAAVSDGSESDAAAPSIQRGGLAAF